ncbi:MAG: C25 family cysteine peptidase [Bacteroidia bacterium]
MKTPFCILFFLAYLCVNQTVAQLYAYDWQVPLRGKPMLKVKIWENGLYRISRQDVIQLEPAFIGSHPDSLRLFYRGEEVPVMLLFHGSPSWSEIEFLGNYHDGKEDQILYKHAITGAPDPSAQTNPRASLFTDTSAYFLVASGGSPALRWENEGDFDYSQTSPESQLLYTSTIDFPPSDGNSSLYLVGGGSPYDSFYAINSDYVLGEGYVSRVSFSQGSSMTLTFPTPAAVSGTQSAQFSARVLGRSNTTHRIRIMEKGMGQTVLDTSWNANQIYLKNYVRNFSTSFGSQLELEFEALGTGPSDNNHLVWGDLRYPRLPDMDDSASVSFDEVPAGSLLRLENCAGSDSVWAFSESSTQRFRGILQGDTAWLNLSALADTGDIFIASDAAIKQPLLENTKLHPLCHPDSGADMIMVTHRSLEASARAYAAFRDSSGFSVKVFFIDEINDAFGYGAPGPLPLQRFFNCALTRWNTSPRYVLLWGDGSYIMRENSENLIPASGFPASDHMLTAPLNSTDFVPQIPIGRLPILEDSAGYNYLEKARVWADMGRREEWMFKGTFVGDLSSTSGRVKAFFGSDMINGDTSCFHNGLFANLGRDSCLFEEAGFRYFFKDHDLQITPHWIRYPAAYDDLGRPSFVFINGSYGADFTQPYTEGFGERWIRYPYKGAVAWLGNTSPGYASFLDTYSMYFMVFFADQMIEQPVGDVINATIKGYSSRFPGIQVKNTCRQMALLGDPSLALSRMRYPASIGDIDEGQDILMYPNPAGKTVFIELGDTHPAEVHLFDMQGRMLREVAESEQGFSISLEGLPAGSYLLRIAQGGRLYSRKLVVF